MPTEGATAGKGFCRGRSPQRVLPRWETTVRAKGRHCNPPLSFCCSAAGSVGVGRVGGRQCRGRDGQGEKGLCRQGAMHSARRRQYTTTKARRGGSGAQAHASARGHARRPGARACSKQTGTQGRMRKARMGGSGIERRPTVFAKNQKLMQGKERESQNQKWQRGCASSRHVQNPAANAARPRRHRRCRPTSALDASLCPSARRLRSACTAPALSATGASGCFGGGGV